MEFIKRIVYWLMNRCVSNPKKPIKVRRQVKDVKPGEKILIEWSMIKEEMGNVICVNNDPETKKILIEIRWGNYKDLKIKEFQKAVFDYSDRELKNFHLLNSISHTQEADNDTDISSLQKRINEALEKEQYEIADELQKKIDKLLKK